MTIQEILKKRSEKIAAVARLETDLVFKELLEFEVGGNRFALETALVHEVVPFEKITPLPRSPSFLAGILSIRRKIYACLYLNELLGFAVKEKNYSKVILLKNSHTEFGILVDEVFGIEQHKISTIDPPLPNFSKKQEKYVSGIVRDILILDAEKILNDPELTIEG